MSLEEEYNKCENDERSVKTIKKEGDVVRIICDRNWEIF